jgi:hypothetical protein
MEQNKTAFKRVDSRDIGPSHEPFLQLLRKIDVNGSYILQPGTVFLGHLSGRGRANHEWQVEEILIVHSWDENDCI